MPADCCGAIVAYQLQQQRLKTPIMVLLTAGPVLLLGTDRSPWYPAGRADARRRPLEEAAAVTGTQCQAAGFEYRENRHGERLYN